MKGNQDQPSGQPGLAAYLAVGQVLRPQGLQGEVKLRPDTDDPARFLGFDVLYQKTPSGCFAPVNVRNVSIRKGFVYLTLDGDASLGQAESRRGLILYIDRAHAAPLKAHENYIADMIGCQLIDTQNRIIGRLKEILQPGSNDVYVVATPEGDLLIPALRHVILDVDTQTKRITVDEARLSEVAVLAD